MSKWYLGDDALISVGDEIKDIEAVTIVQDTDEGTAVLAYVMGHEAWRTPVAHKMKAAEDMYEALKKAGLLVCELADIYGEQFSDDENCARVNETFYELRKALRKARGEDE